MSHFHPDSKVRRWRMVEYAQPFIPQETKIGLREKIKKLFRKGR